MTTYHSSLCIFMTNKTPSGAKICCKSTEPESHRVAKMFFFLLIVLFFRRAGSKLCDFLTSFHMKQQYFTLGSATAHHFFITL